MVSAFQQSSELAPTCESCMGAPQTMAASQFISISSTALPNTVKPNQTIDATVYAQNTAGVISPTDPNACNETSFFSGNVGLKVTVELAVNGSTVDTATECVGTGGQKTKFPLQWITPNVSSTQTYNVEYKVSYAGSGESITTISKQVEVRVSAPSQTPPSGGAGSGSTGNVTFPPNLGLGGLGSAVSNAVGSLTSPLLLLAVGGGGALLLLLALRGVGL